jgi:ABC-2 type transport system ATP-binding protein
LNDIVISTQGLSKSYNGRPALQGLDLEVPRGAIYGFLGRNGAGKTTTLKLLLGMLRPDAGEIRLMGEPIRSEKDSVASRRRIAFVTEDKELYPSMSVGEMIRFTRPFYPGWRPDLEGKYLELFRLPLNKSICKLSKGMLAQLMLLLAMARGAELLMMDEPTSGLDPVATEEVLQALAVLAAGDGATIFFSSHHLSEVEQICDRVCLIDDGKTVIDGVLDDLKLQYRRVVAVFDREPPQTLTSLSGIGHLRRRGRTVSILAHNDVDSVVDRVREFGPASVEIHAVSLKELFLEHVRGE